MKVQFSLNFFAAAMCAPRNEITGFALLSQTERGTEPEVRPVVLVKCMDHHVYDIKTAKFVSTESTPEVKRSIEPAKVKESGREYIFKSKTSEVAARYSKRDFERLYEQLVVNKKLRG